MAKKKIEKIPNQKYEKFVNITTESMKKNTGKTWDEWIEILNKAGAFHWTYQETTAYLQKKRRVVGFWKQWIAIGYETAVGKIKHTFETDAGVFGEIRTMLATRRIRFTWQEGDWDKSTTVQLLLIPRANGSTILCFMHEKLRDGRLKQPLREYWTQIAEQLATMAKTMV